MKYTFLCVLFLVLAFTCFSQSTLSDAFVSIADTSTSTIYVGPDVLSGIIPAGTPGVQMSYRTSDGWNGLFSMDGSTLTGHRNLTGTGFCSFDGRASSLTTYRYANHNAWVETNLIDTIGDLEVDFKTPTGLSITGINNSAASSSFNILDHDSKPLFRVGNNGVITASKLPKYKNDSAAGKNGLTSGQLYQDSKGLIRVKQ